MKMEFERFFDNIKKCAEERIELEDYCKHLLLISQLKKPCFIPEVRKKYNAGELVLVLGAGVSISCGLPDWNKLLQILLANTFEKDQTIATLYANIFDSIFNLNNLVIGRFLDDYFKDKDFESEVRKSLYANFKNGRNDLVDGIADFCIERKDSPKLDSIITYNFDDILEDVINTKLNHIRFQSIYKDYKSQLHNELFIYHVHGYLPRNDSLTDLNKITFSENSYHRQYLDIYSWQNITQINKFRDKTCLFIGSSLTDPNLRRLLDISNYQRDKAKFHYIIKQRHNYNSVKQNLETYFTNPSSNQMNKLIARLNEAESIRFLCEAIERFEESDALSFNIKTIWVDDHTEITSILKKIQNTLVNPKTK